MVFSGNVPPVAGLVFLPPPSHCVMASRSYVCPSPVQITGSIIRESVMGQEREDKASSSKDMVG